MTLPSPNRSIVDNQRLQTQEMRTWMQTINDMTMKVGNGSPEGVVTAIEGASYTDLDATTGSRIYSKNGSGNTGWILV